MSHYQRRNRMTHRLDHGQVNSTRPCTWSASLRTLLIHTPVESNFPAQFTGITRVDSFVY